MPYQCQPLMDPASAFRTRPQGRGPESPLTVLGSRAPPGWAEPNQATRGNVAWEASGAASPLGSNKPGNWCQQWIRAVLGANGRITELMMWWFIYFFFTFTLFVDWYWQWHLETVNLIFSQICSDRSDRQKNPEGDTHCECIKGSLSWWPFRGTSGHKRHIVKKKTIIGPSKAKEAQTEKTGSGLINLTQFTATAWWATGGNVASILLLETRQMVEDCETFFTLFIILMLSSL